MRASGAYVFDAQGRRYLDAYNNVPVLGHSHPAVVNAVSAQLRVLTTNARYLHGHAVELAERLTGHPAARLDTCVLVNSGTEAVDLAWRIACAATGRDRALISEYGYHGMTDATTPCPPTCGPGVSDRATSRPTPRRTGPGGATGGTRTGGRSGTPPYHDAARRPRPRPRRPLH